MFLIFNQGTKGYMVHLTFNGEFNQNLNYPSVLDELWNQNRMVVLSSSLNHSIRGQHFNKSINRLPI